MWTAGPNVPSLKEQNMSNVCNYLNAQTIQPLNRRRTTSPHAHFCSSDTQDVDSYTYGVILQDTFIQTRDSAIADKPPDACARRNCAVKSCPLVNDCDLLAGFCDSQSFARRQLVKPGCNSPHLMRFLTTN